MLANHNLIPRYGTKITLAMLPGRVRADGRSETGRCGRASPSISDVLDLHNALEHDGLLSRSDAHLATARPFSRAVFDEYVAFCEERGLAATDFR